jgi:hypothetical protein
MKRILIGAVFGAGLTAALLYLLNLGGWVVFTGSAGSWFLHILHWSHANLGFSIVPFILVGMIYCRELTRLRRLLHDENTTMAEVEDVEAKLNLMVVVFIGIGVIWTAIGMRSALLQALNGMDAETAASRGAWYILTRLVDGGILVALSTTIVGGVGGFCMRIVKAWSVGPTLSGFYDRRHARSEEEVLRLLAEIRDRVGATSADPARTGE